MSLSFNKIVKYCLLVTSISFFSLYSHADVSVQESPSYDGTFSISIPQSDWDIFADSPQTHGTLIENNVAIATLSWGENSYSVSKSSSGVFNYELIIQGPYPCMCNGGTRSSSVSVEVLIPSTPDPLPEPNVRLDLDDFDIYYGDFNNDGTDGDIYFHGKDLFVLIAADISIPLFLEGEEGFVVYEFAGSNGYTEPFGLTLDEEELNAYQKAAENYDFYRGDINGDGDEDRFVRGAEAGDAVISVIQTDIGYPDIYVVNISTIEHFDPSDRNNTLQLIDYNLDGRADLVWLSGPDGYVLDVIYSESTGEIDEGYFTVSNLNDLFSFNTFSANVTGTMSGSFKVNESGAATYSIPVLTPEGSAGVTPSVGFSYSSQGGNGLLGKGWSLSASSGISRCRQTLNQDKQALPIAWNSNDRFCLNGQRLLLVGGSAYGASGSQYRTEIDSQIIVTAHGQTGGEPDFFSAVKKDGSITYFGLTSGLGAGTNSKQTFASGKTLTWNESVTTDNMGNPIKYFYAHESGKNFRLEEIRYAYGAKGSGATSANTIIDFNYEQRPDITTGWLAGQKSQQKWRLKKVDVNNRVNSMVNVRSYHLFYNREMAGNASTKRSLLGAVQECVGSSCKKPTRFEWDLVSGEIEPLNSSSFAISTDRRALMNFKQADFNGDGILDVAWLHHFWDQDFIGGSLDTPLQYAISTNGSLVKAEFAEGGDIIEFPENGQDESISIEPIDFNVDGRSDLAVYRSRGTYAGQWVVYLSVPTVINGTTDWRLTKTPIPLGTGGYFMDINGDGLKDLVKGTSSGLYAGTSVSFLKPKFQNPSENDYKSDNFYAFEYAYAFDWEGTGNINSYGYWAPNVTYDPVNDPNHYEVNPQTQGYQYLGQGDFNGDGLIDIVGGHKRVSIIDASYTNTNTRIFALRQKADGDFTVIKDFGFGSASTLKVLDANSDGLSDLLEKDGLTLKLHISNGNGFEAPKTVATITAQSNIQITDYNLDGYVDIVEFVKGIEGQDYRPKLYLWDDELETYKSPELINIFLDGLASSMFLDVNGDGLTDLVTYQDKNLETRLFESNYQKFEAISGIDTGYGAKTNISYEPINTSSNYSSLDVNPVVVGSSNYCVISGSPRLVCKNYDVYEADDFYYSLNKGIESSLNRLKIEAPTLEMNGPFHVVTRVTNRSTSTLLDNNVNNLSGNNGAGSMTDSVYAAVSYHYNEAKIQAGGQGFLGFHSLTTEDEQTGVKTTTIYRQDYPFIGSPLSTFVYAPDGNGLLKESHNAYSLKDWPSNAQGLVDSNGTAALGPIKPYVNEAVEINYLSKSSAATGGDIELVTGSQINIGDCTSSPGCHPYLNQTTTQQISHKTVSLTEIDSSGNVVSQTIETIGDGLSQKIETTNEYGTASDTVSLHGLNLTFEQLGRLTKSTVEKSRNGQTDESRYSSFEYYPSGLHEGMLYKEFVSPEPDANNELLNEKLETIYSYNDLGLLTNKVVKGWDGNAIVERGGSSTFDATGRFLEYSTDALGHKLNEILSRNEYGAATLVQSVNGAQASTAYDSWGREVATASNVGGSSSTSYVFCPNSGVVCPNLAKTAVIQRSSAANNNIVAVSFYDFMGREIRTGARSFDGSMTYVDREYDLLGRVVRKSEPYFESEVGTSHTWTRNYFDVLGRPLALYAADGSTGYFEYDGYTQTSINDLGQKKIERKNGLGELIEAEDELGGKIVFSYTTAGEVRTTTAITSGSGSYSYGVIPGLCEQPTSNLQVVLCYDRLGRKTSMWDPDKGYWTYEYNAFGELIKQTNANGDYVETQYDLLGRTLIREDRKQSGALEGYTTWHYDNEDDLGQAVNNAILQTTAVAYSAGHTHSYGDVTNKADHVTRTLFDNYGRAFITEQELPNGEVYRTEIDFDSEGRVETEWNVLNDVIVRSGAAIESGVTNHYNEYGFLDYILNLEDGKEIYRATSFDEKGNLKTASIADAKISITNNYYQTTGLLSSRSVVAGGVTQSLNYEWDSIGNLTSRINQNSTLTSSNHLVEEFCYDELNRLTKNFKSINGSGSFSGSVCPTNSSAFDVSYDEQGNIQSKLNVGAYSYGAVGSNGNRAGPHALSSVVNGGVTRSFNYDKNGNVLNDGERNFTYGTYDKPLLITKGGHTTEFKYGASRSRFYRKDTNAQGVQETWYLGNVEKILRTDGAIEWRRSLEGGGLYTYVTNASNVETQALKKRYILKDHLGSSSLILEESGSNIIVAQSLSFDAWGQRRDAQNMNSLSATQLANFDHGITTRGYTGHEMLDEVGIIHMNGRIYDASLGRFLQADPFIQAPTDTQSYNRYAYVRNNPLNATDPSGYIWQLAVAAAAGYMAQEVGEAIHAPWLSAIGGIVTCASGAMSGAAISCAGGFAFGSTYSATGNFSQALEAGLFAAGSAWAYSKVGEHFSDIGASNKQFANIFEGISGVDITGNWVNFGGNLLSAGQVMQQIAAHAVLGGIIADLQGGKFGHGFVSAGFTKSVMGGAGFNYNNKSFGAVTGRTLTAALVGGTTSKLSGGKFSNGAVTAAIAHLFNAESGGDEKQSFASYFGERVLSGQVRDDLKNVLGAYFKIASGEITFAGGWFLKKFNRTVGGYMMVDGASIYTGGVADLSNAIYGTSVEGDFMKLLYRNAATTYGFSDQAGDMARAGVSLLTVGGAWMTQVPRTVPGSGWTYMETEPAITSAAIVELANDAWTARDALQTLAP